jgi:cyclohexyl-isocyanide hydratase
MEIAMLLFPRLTQLDLTGPHEVLSRVPGAQVHLVAATREPVMSETGLAIVPTAVFADVLNPTVVFAPGGYGQIAAIDDGVTLPWLRAAGLRARWVTSACTGALLLGAAGLLRGYRAATHWAFMDLLPAVGAIPTDERVVIDRDRITGGGVTAGIDIALALAERLAGRDLAANIALQLEYDPHPAYPGHPRTADPALVAATRERMAKRHEERRAQLERLQ